MSKAAAAAVEWTRVYSKLGLSKETVSTLQAFRKRHDDARIANNGLKEQKADIDFAHYREVLKNKDVISQAEKLYNDFKPVDYDLGAQLKAIDAFEAKAVEAATQAESKIDTELQQLNGTLKDIEDARPFEDLTLHDLNKARPEIAQVVESMMKRGKFTVDGYQEKFGNLSAI
ncbi:uncharacterized protein L969DRAFT_20022 [Mixia osmundae IAM 14324]|uniref:ATP synthase subunit d, mitochondrial n=1 Tax=Mixia osmundae (strain CBS 9802 / IAM 14324 / JCM 22182 / KY 12970) TaxID=764103 RepID=G7E1G6_MIXOS|nr:uncharacterized protein L969DRAFT_20022 [Mixia osmundae IAM 14324]KEI36630.1 hypothetical protein L969DRAFT_20022 [Mixia osmundae IAM 14324]GAA96676.1 hypothetical protein E5Q_03347 [Mixia osmundae IAM 14324]